ncbi:hypothetical protein KCP78_09950 [Salmonella enterica subsp. enterica]|nr:hypothetical protein KCP78_09950 [Salmonella enterica subsp. enterica]
MLYWTSATLLSSREALAPYPFETQQPGVLKISRRIFGTANLFACAFLDRESYTSTVSGKIAQGELYRVIREVIVEFNFSTIER